MGIGVQPIPNPESHYCHKVFAIRAPMVETDTESALKTHSMRRQRLDLQPVSTGFLYQPANSFAGDGGGEDFMTLTTAQVILSVIIQLTLTPQLAI